MAMDNFEQPRHSSVLKILKAERKWPEATQVILSLSEKALRPQQALMCAEAPRLLLLMDGGYLHTFRDVSCFTII